MSFSSDVKKELSKLNTFMNNNLNYSELMGYLLTIDTKGKIKYSTENEYNINRFSKLLSNLEIDYDIKTNGKVFIVSIKNAIISDYENIASEDEIKALIRGAFLGTGSVSNPKITYHLEITFPTQKNANYISNRLENFDIQSKIVKRNNRYMVYIKEGEDISSFLALTGANGQVLKFEEERVLRDMKNNVNRLVNCETANLNKTINASVQQINDIEFLKKKGEFSSLSQQLQDIANMRLKYPDISLSELGELLNPAITKSGVSHRLKKILNIANELRGRK